MRPRNSRRSAPTAAPQRRGSAAPPQHLGGPGVGFRTMNGIGSGRSLVTGIDLETVKSLIVCHASKNKWGPD